MKKLLFFAFALAFSSGLKAQTYTPVAVTGYNADVVADGTGAASASTSHDVDGVNYNFMAAGYTNPSNVTTTKGLPATGTISTAVTATPGLTFQLAPYTANNSLRINGTGTGTLTFPTAIAAEKVYVLATSGSGNSVTTITVNFTDATSQAFTQAVNDWYGGTGYAINGIGRVNRTDNGIDNNANDPRLYQYELSLNVVNTTKQIQSITFSNNGSVLNVMGVSIKNAAAPVQTDAGIAGINTPVSPVMQNLSVPVQVTLVNQGTTALTAATITWTVDGVAQTSYNWAGNLTTNQTAVVTLGNFTFTPGSHTINACATNPNNLTDGFAANDCSQLTLNACSVLSGTYTIDKNSPVSATNYQTIASAVSALTGCGVTGPVTFNVVAGSGPYNEQVEITAIPGASATNTITFNGNGDTIQASPVSATRYVIKLNGADHVTISNFTLLTSTASTYGWGIHFINGADNNTISNNIISIGSTSSTVSNSTGIVFSGSATGATTTGNNGNNNVISGNTINGGYKGIALYNLTTSPGNNQIINNTIKNFYAVGIELNTAVGTLVENNNISRPDRSGTVGTFEGITLTGGTRNSIISKNRIHSSHLAATSGTVYGFHSNANDAPAGSENIVKNNLVYNIGTTGTIYGIHNIGSNGVYYYHNTFNLDNTSAGTVRGFNQTTEANNIKFKNNIVNIVGGTAGAKHAVYFGSTTSATIATDIESNNNVLYVTGGSSSSGYGYYSSNRATLSDWQTASGDDANSVATDPAFTSITTGNFLPTALTANNIGLPVVPAVTDDITGAVRSVATPDAGAYEFTPAGAPTSDAGVTAITTPNSGCNLTNQEVVTITINNFGTAALSNIPVSYTINGGSAVAETFAGPVAPGTTATYAFTATANLSTPGSYSIVASTNVTGDALATNDSFTKVVVSSVAPVAPTVTAGGPVTFCTGGSVVLTAASTTTGATFTWFNNGTLITGANAATYTATTSGNYTAVATDNGCASPASAATTVTVNALPAAPTVTAGGALTFCDGGSVTLTAASTTTGVTYEWSLNGTAIPGATAATYTANAAGNYTVTALANGCSATSTATVVNVTPLPATPTITRNGFVLTSSSASGNQWHKDGTAIPGATNPTYTTTSNGNYTVIVTANGCASAASSPISIVNTGIKGNQAELAASVYPNPSNGIFNLQLPEGKAFELTVTDLTGKIILHKKAVKETSQIELQNAAKGIYLLKLVGDGQTLVRKLVKE